MLRAILKHRLRDANSGAEQEFFQTIDFECPALEETMKHGGYNEAGYEVVDLVGIERLP
jgi:hypothetical protein